MKPRFLPKFPIFVQDWMGSLRVQAMSCEEEGGLLRLCMLQWNEGGLPADPETLMRLCRITGSAVDHPLLVGAFPVCRDGLRRNPKVATVRAEAEAYCAAQAAKGRASGLVRANRGSTSVEPNTNPARTQSNPPNSELLTPKSVPTEHKARKRAVLVPEAVLSEFPDFDRPTVLAALNEYLEARKAKHGSWTPQGLRIGLGKFKGQPADAVVRAFKAATEGPWQTIWPGDPPRGPRSMAQASRYVPNYAPDPTPINANPPSLSELLRQARA